MSPELVDKLHTKYRRIFPSNYGGVDIECGDGWFDIIDALCHCVQDRINFSRQNRLRDLRLNRAIKAGWAGNKKPLEKYYQFGNVQYKVMPKISDRVDEMLAKRTLVKPSESIRQVVATQVKEKFGGLRFYYSGGDNYIDGIVRMAEDLSMRTCEKCGGRAGKTVNSGWIKTFCLSCSNK